MDRWSQGSTGKARQGNPRQHEPRAQMTYSESGWCLAEGVVSKLGSRVVLQLWGGPAPSLVIPNHAMVVQSFNLGGYLLAREAGPISRSKQNLDKPFHGQEN